MSGKESADSWTANDYYQLAVLYAVLSGMALALGLALLLRQPHDDFLTFAGAGFWSFSGWKIVQCGRAMIKCAKAENR